MSGAINEAFLLAVLTLKSIEDGSSITINATNIAKNDEIPTTYYYPIIKSIGEVGSSVGDFLPEAISSSIILDNSPNSFGFERRFSDLLDRYTIINQQIQIAIGIGVEGSSSTATRATEYVGVVQSIAISDNEIRIAIAGQGINDRIMTCVVDGANLTVYPAAPSQSLGQSIPIVLGSSVEVKPILIEDTNSNIVKYAYQTTLGTQFKGGSISKYYCREIAGLGNERTYLEVNGAASTSTKLFDKITGTLSTSPPFSNEEPHRTRDISPSTGENYILTHAEVVFLQGTAGNTGNIVLEIWVKDPNGIPYKKVADSNRNKADFTWGAGNVTVYFIFQSPVPLTAPTGYVAYITQTVLTGGTVYPTYITGGGAGSATSYTRSNSAGASTFESWTKHVVSQRNFASAFYGVVLAVVDPTSTEIMPNGLSYQYFSATMILGGSWAGLGFPDLTDLDFIVKCAGLKDNSSGTITGVANAVITNPVHMANVLSYEWNGSSWVAGQFNTATHSASQANLTTSGAYYRQIGLVTQGQNTRIDILQRIARASACKFTMSADTSTPLGLYAWGSKVQESIWIDEEDFSLLSYQVLGTETIVNAVEMYYATTLRPLAYPLQLNGLNQYRDYEQRLFWNYQTNSETAAISTVSNTCFGERRNADPEYAAIQDQTSAYNIIRFLLKTYALPHHYIEIDVPYIKYKSLSLLSVIGICSTQIPAFFGTTQAATMPTYAGDATNINEGYEFRRANIVRAMIESKRVVFEGNQAPILRLRARILNNPKDPT